MKSTLYCRIVSLTVSCLLPTWFPIVVLAQPEAPIRVACLGDSHPHLHSAVGPGMSCGSGRFTTV
jgi:hypothetical protein